MPQTRDLRIKRFRPLVPPAILLEELPLSEAGATTVTRARAETVRILREEDDRLVVVVGPCSVHDPAAGLDYAQRLRKLGDELLGDLCIIMRVYFEKPRTTVGWKGLINDPRLDGSFAINEGLRLGRRFLLDLAEMGMPAGSEFLDPISPQFISDLVSWGAIGARTTESQVHRELASGLSMPVGFKNSTGGGVQVAIDAVRSAAHPHSFAGVTEQGLCAIVETVGNADCHVILRGGHTGPNYDAPHVQKVVEALRAAGLPARIMIDTSHGNSSKDYRRQPLVARAIAEQVAAGETAIFGVMMESFLVEGRQELRAGVTPRYGQSITDACLGWDMTFPVLQELAEAVRARRARRAAAGT
jgi:3-deoxy-7-phosphoheptulonate synthase